MGARAEMDEMEIVRHAVGAEYCAIGETTTRFFSVRPRSRNGVNIGGTARLVDARLVPAPEPASRRPPA